MQRFCVGWVRTFGAAVIAFGIILGASGPVGAQSVPFPSLDDERNTYRRWGWTWTVDKEPNFPAEPGYVVRDPDIHGDTEGDDLWMYVMQWRRTGQQGFLDRARAWARYMRDDYRQCVGSDSYRTYCYDRDAHFLDHVYVGGLIEYYTLTGDASYLAAAENICGDIAALWTGSGQWGSRVPGQFGMATGFSMRGFGRNFLAIARCYEHNPTRWGPVLTRLTDLWVLSPDWIAFGPSGGGFYAFGQSSTDYVCGAGAYANGARVQAAFWMGILGEAMYHAYRLQPTRTDIRDKIVAMGRFVKDYGLDPVTKNSFTYFGVNINTGARVGCQGSQYSTISLTNLLVFASWYTSGAESAALLARAKEHVDYGTRYYDGTPQGQVSHFLDSVKDSASGGFYMGYNKGELQYAWAALLPVTTGPPPPSSGDTQAPVVAMTAPASGSTVSGTVTVSASASDNVGVVGVQFRLDGAPLGAERTAPPYSVSWDTRTASDGAHTLSAVARDAAGNVGTASVTVTVSNAASQTSALAALAAQMQPGTWATLTTNNINATLRANGASGNAIGYSEDIVWDPVSRRLFFAGGDHNDLAQFISYTESTNTWQVLPRPSWMPSGTMHGYDHSAIDPGRRYFYHRPFANNTIYRYHIDTGAWTSLPQPPVAGTACCNALEYFPDMDALVWVDAYGQVAVFRESTQQWTLLASLGAGTTWQMAEYNPVHRLVVFALGDRLYRLTPDGRITSLGSLPVSIYDGSGYNGVFTVDPVSGDFIISTPAQNVTRTFYRYNVVTGTSQRLASQPTPDLRNTMMLATPLSTHRVVLFVYCYIGTPCGVLLYKDADSSSLPPPPPPSGDTQAPVVAMTAPASGSTVSGTVTVSANASDNVGVVGVQFRLDGAPLGAERTAPPYSVSWDTRTASNGAHTLSAVARDAAGNVGTASVTVTVSNDTQAPGGGAAAPADTTPPSTPTGLTATPVSASQINLAWTASTDNVGVAGYRVYRNGAQVATTAATSFQDTGLTAATTYTYRVAAFDAAGNVSAQSASASATTSPSSFTLTITKTGNGTVTSSPGSINCGSACSATYTSGTLVRLTAVPDSGYVFSGWSGDSDCSDGSVTMNASKTCRATFTAQTASPPSIPTSGSPNGPVFVTAPGPGPGQPARIRAFTRTGTPVGDFLAYPEDVELGANVAFCDVDGDGVKDIITGPGPGPGYGPHVRAFRIDGTPIPGLSFLAYGSGVGFGVNVACGDLDGDGRAEIITGPGPGAGLGAHVRAYTYDPVSQRVLDTGVSFLAYPGVGFGVNVAAGDLDGDGRAEIITGPGPGASLGAHVRAFRVDTSRGVGRWTVTPMQVSFLAYPPGVTFGVNVAAGDLDGDGRAEIITGPGPGASLGAHVRAFRYDLSQPGGVSDAGVSFLAYPPDVGYGVRVGTADLDGDGRAEIITGPGPGPGLGTNVRAFRFDPAQPGGVRDAGLNLDAYPGFQYGVRISPE